MKKKKRKPDKEEIIRELSISCRMIQISADDLEEGMTVWYTTNHNPYTGCGPFKVVQAGDRIALKNVNGVQFGIEKLKTRVQFYVPTRQTFKTPNNPFTVWGV